MDVNGREDQQSSGWFAGYLNRQGDWLEKTRGELMIVATVIAGMSFHVMVNPPGGVWQSHNCGLENHNGTVPACNGIVGTSVLEHESTKRVLYLGLVTTSTVSFSASMSLILLVISGFRLRYRMIMAILISLMTVAVICISAAFFCAVALVQYSDSAIVFILIIYLIFWVVFPVLIIVIQLVRLLVWLICCICCCKPRR